MKTKLTAVKNIQINTKKMLLSFFLDWCTFLGHLK